MNGRVDLLQLLMDIASLYEANRSLRISTAHSDVASAALEHALKHHVHTLKDHPGWKSLVERCDVQKFFTLVGSVIAGLAKEYPDVFPKTTELLKTPAMIRDDAGYEKLVNYEIAKYKDVLLAAFPSLASVPAAYAVQHAQLTYLTLDGVNRIVDELLREGRIAEVGYKNGVMQYVCVDTDRKDPAVPVVENKHFELTSPNAAWEKEVVLSALKGNTYDHIDTISKRLSQSSDPKIAQIAAEPPTLQRILKNLVTEGAAITKFSPSGQVRFWKKPVRKYKKMRSGEWKKRVVEFLDAAKGIHFSSSALIMQLQQKYPEANHGSVGSALDRLAKDGKLKRFHRRKIGEKRYEYWTTPVGPLPMPPKKR